MRPAYDCGVAEPTAAVDRLTMLSELQRAVLAAMAGGSTNLEIADELGLSPERVKEVVASVLWVLGVDSREAAVERYRATPPRAQSTMLAGVNGRGGGFALQAFGAIAAVAIAIFSLGALLRDEKPAAATPPSPGPSVAVAQPTLGTPLPTRRIRPTPTPDLPGTIAAKRPATPLDDIGWPIIRCGAGNTPFRMSTIRVGLCVPAEWVVTESTAADERQGMFSTLLRAAPAGVRFQPLEVQFISRRSAINTAVLEPVCNERTDGTKFLGLRASRCDATWDVPNGMPIHPSLGWTTVIMVESIDHWVLVELNGLERTPAEIEVARASLVSVIGTVAENSCQSPTPSQC